MKRLGSRGSILAQVLVTAVVVSVITSGIMRMLMTRYTSTARVELSSKNTRNAVGSFSRLMTAWNAAGGAPCTNGGGYSCAPSGAGPCGCICTPTDPSMARVRACNGGPGGTCHIRAYTPGAPTPACP